jgi:hypothetical protein
MDDTPASLTGPTILVVALLADINEPNSNPALGALSCLIDTTGLGPWIFCSSVMVLCVFGRIDTDRNKAWPDASSRVSCPGAF